MAQRFEVTTSDVPTSKDKRTIPYLSAFEKARLIAERATQLDYNAETTLTFDELQNLKKKIPTLGTVDIALEELKRKIIPLNIVRVFPSGYREVWKINEFIMTEEETYVDE